MPPRSSTRYAAALLLLLALAACASAPERAADAALERLGEPLEQPWSVKLDDAATRFALLPAGPCLLLAAWPPAPRGAPEPLPGRLTCFDPASGDPRWHHTIPAGPTLTERLLTTEDRALLVRGSRVTALELDSGRLAWSFDGADRSLEEALLTPDLLVLDLNHRSLVALEARTGAWRGAVQLADERLQAVTSSPEGAALAVLSSPGPPARLVAVDLASLQGAAPEPPWLPREHAWTRPLEEPLAGGVVAAGDVLLNLSRSGELEILEPASGEPLHVERFKEPPPDDPRQRARWLAATRRDAYATLDRDLDPGLLPRHARPLLTPADDLLLLLPEPGFALGNLVLQSRDPRSLQPRWTRATPLRAEPTARADLSEARVTALASRGEVLFVDADSGALLHHTRLPRRSLRWRTLATDGRAIYLIIKRNKSLRLEARPR